MRQLATLVIGIALILPVCVSADDLFPLDKITMGADVNSVKTMGFDIDWDPLKPIDPGEGRRRRPEEARMGIAFASITDALWNGALLGWDDNRITSVAYVNALLPPEKSQELVLTAYKELITRYGKPDQVLVSQQFARNGTRNEPVFLWKRPERTIAFMYAPFALADDDRQNVALQVMGHDLPLAKRYKMVEVSPSEVQRLTIDVAGITDGAPDPDAARRAQALKDFVSDYGRVTEMLKRSDANTLPQLAGSIRDRWAARDRAAYGTLTAFALNTSRSDLVTRRHAVPQDLVSRYAREALATYDPKRSDNITIESQFSLTSLLYGPYVQSSSGLSEADWQAQRRQGAQAWLTLWQRLEDAIDPSWGPNERLPLYAPVPKGVSQGFDGMWPDSISDPDLRRQYEKAIADHAKQRARRNEQLKLRNLRTGCAPMIQKFLSTTYSIAPRNDNEWRQLVTTYVKDPETRKQFLSPPPGDL